MAGGHVNREGHPVFQDALTGDYPHRLGERGAHILVALTGKLLPQTLIFLTIFLGYEWYVYGYLNFPHPGGLGMIIFLAILTVLSSQGFGVLSWSELVA